MEQDKDKKNPLDDYTRVRLLGKGSYGEVYLVERKDNKQMYALKTMDKVHMAREKKQHHVYIEREVLSAFKSPWLTALHNCFQDKSRLYFVMENVRNGELASYLELHQKLDLNQAQFIAAEIVLILEFLRKCGIVHRDLKPENLLLDENNHLKVIDFGTGKFVDNGSNKEFVNKINGIKNKFAADSSKKPVAQDHDETLQEKLEHRNSFVGTPIYLSPELIREEDVSFPADIWALGIILYKMITGILPYKNISDYDMYEAIKNDQLPFPEDTDATAKDLINKLLDKNPKTRLGCGTEESGNGISALKAHPFFKGIDWENLRSIESPIKKALNPLTAEKETDYTKEVTKKPQPLLSGQVRKIKNLFMWNTRQLILYDNATVEYFDPEDGSRKGAIKLASDCAAKKKDKETFFLTVPGRTYEFKAMEYSADEWVNLLTSEISQLAKAKQPAGGPTLEDV